MDVKNLYYELTSVYRSADSKVQDSAWEIIQRCYGSKFRYYHNFDHIESMLAHLAPIWEAINALADIQLAVIYHDVAYDPVATDNEEQSAAIARDSLFALNFPSERIDRITQQILATKTHQESRQADTNFLLDADRAILGEPPSKYNWYCQQIRLEYTMFADPIYRTGRRRVLQNFLDQDWIYYTPHFRQRYEQQAKTNIAREIRSL
ncbi:MAG: HD domain-containing protein [Sphingobacterium sp.]